MENNFPRYGLLLLLSILLPSFTIASVASHNACYLSKKVLKVDLTPCLKYLPEDQKRFGIKEVMGLDKEFRQVCSPNFGFVDHPYWLRLAIKNIEKTRLLRLLEIQFPFLDKVELYMPDRSGSFRVQTNGRDIPFSKRHIKCRNILFPLTLIPGENRFYLRIETESAMFFPAILWQEQYFWQKEKRANFALGIYYGIMAAMALYNLFIFFSLKDRAYLYYVLYIISFGLYQMTSNGLAYEYLWPDAVWWNRHSTIFFAGCAAAFAALFSQRFLNTKQVSHILHKALWAMCLVSVLLAISSFFVSYGITVKVALALAAVFVGLMLFSGILSLKRGQRSARFYLLAWIFLLTGIAILILRNIGLLPPSFFVLYAIQIGSILDVLLLSFALADRINELRVLRETALRQVIKERKKSQRQRETMIRELHDGIGAIATNISVLAQKARIFKPSKEVDQDLVLISELAQRGREEIQNFMQCLDQGDIDLETLVAELRYWGNQLMDANGIEFFFKYIHGPQKSVKFSPFETIHILKIYQEALTNVIKHSGASRVEVELGIEGKTFFMSVKDNGQGKKMTMGEDPNEGRVLGRGIRNMKKRAEDLNGSLEIKAGNGVEVRVLIPVSEK